MTKMLFKISSCLAAIFICLMLGKVLNHLLGGLPASLYGLLLFAALLNSKILNPDHCSEVIAKIIFFMPIVFLPVCIGVMQYFDLFEIVGFKVLFIGIVTTLLGLVFVAFTAKWALARSTNFETPVSSDAHKETALTNGEKGD